MKNTLHTDQTYSKGDSVCRLLLGRLSTLLRFACKPPTAAFAFDRDVWQQHFISHILLL